MSDDNDDCSVDIDEAAIWAEVARFEKRQRWRALLTIFQRKRWADGRTWRDIPLFIAFALCLLSGRSYRRNDRFPSYRYEVMTYWGFRYTYGGWECWCCDFCLPAFRYHIYEDGDSSL